MAATFNKRDSKSVASTLNDKNEIRYRAVKVLRAAKKYVKLKDLSDLTGISMPLISRYINGRLTPNYATSQQLLKSILRKDVIAEILLRSLSSVKMEKGSVYALDVAASDPDLLYLIGEYIAQDSNCDFDVIVTPEAGGITFASAAALVTGKKLVVASRRRPIDGAYLEVPVVRDPTHIEYYYIPSRLLGDARKAIIVDDFSVRGATIQALIDALESNNIAVKAVYLMVALGTEWAKVPNVKAILTLS